MAVVVVHASDKLTEGAAYELFAVRAGPDEVRRGADEAADRQVQRELLPWAVWKLAALDGAAARQREPQRHCAKTADQVERKLFHGFASQGYRAARF
ncbi:Uncharacterised protein [Chlamydia trachomatis]|nr:Uncharacterised protein [Chlamydia trachomatis]CRH27267.1 Uncharacterised protein [Chlamydia trachomatis]